MAQTGYTLQRKQVQLALEKQQRHPAVALRAAIARLLTSWQPRSPKRASRQTDLSQLSKQRIIKRALISFLSQTR
jgi:hypothetical protein